MISAIHKKKKKTAFSSIVLQNGYYKTFCRPLSLRCRMTEKTVKMYK